MRQHTIRRMVGLSVVAAGLVAGVLPAGAAPGVRATSAAPSVIQDPMSAAYPYGEDLYQALKQGQAFQCLNDSPCRITATIKLSKGEKKYLGAPSRTVAHGKPVGPQTVGFQGDRQHGIYLLPLPSWFKKRIVAKHVVSMYVFITLTTFYEAQDPSDQEGLKMATFESVWPKPGNTSRFMEGQGTRYGCRTVAGGNITVGYVRQGQSCP